MSTSRVANSQRHTTLGADLEALAKGVLHVLERFTLGLPLADAPGDGWAGNHPHAILVSVESHEKLHGRTHPVAANHAG